jgi:hypothetical protein
MIYSFGGKGEKYTMQDIYSYKRKKNIWSMY